MDALSEYLIKSSVWLTGFELVYFLFLRNERYFRLNRIFLLSGIIASLCFPLIQFHYTILMSAPEVVEFSGVRPAAVAVIPKEQNAPDLLFYLYLSGIIWLIIRLLKQTFSVVGVVRKSGFILLNEVRLVRTDRYPSPFSLFSYVFANPSFSEADINEIVLHEREHIRQRHWIDLILFEFLCILQWFNPLVWLYGRFIRQNHEYLADESALSTSLNPARYRAALLNQMLGVQVVSLSNSFNYSLNKKRFAMMKYTISSPVRKLRLLWILPLIAGVFYAFATPEYEFVRTEENAVKQTITKNMTSRAPVHLVDPTLKVRSVVHNDKINSVEQKVQDSTSQPKGSYPDQDAKKIVRGKVIDEYGNPLEGVSVVTSRTNRTKTDVGGNFELDMTDDDPVSFSHAGLKTTWRVMPDFEKSTIVKMKPEFFNIGVFVGFSTVHVKSPSKYKSSPDKNVENKVEDKADEKDDKIYTIVEQMPEFPGGTNALRRFIGKQLRYPEIAKEDTAQGQILVNFIVNREGNIWNVKILKSVHPALDQEAIRVIYSLPKWKPGVHHGKTVNVAYSIPISISYKEIYK